KVVDDHKSNIINSFTNTRVEAITRPIESLGFGELQSLPEVVDRVDDHRVVDEVGRVAGGLAGTRILMVQVLEDEAVRWRTQAADHHAFTEVLIADVRDNVLPLRVGRIFRRLSGVEADVA